MNSIAIETSSSSRHPAVPAARRPAAVRLAGTTIVAGAVAALVGLAGCATAPMGSGGAMAAPASVPMTMPSAPYVRYGDASTVYSTGVKVNPGAPLYFTSGATAGPDAPATMKGQAQATLKRLTENLKTAGFAPSDVVFVRAYLAPGSDGKVDYAGWNEAWAEMFGTAVTPAKPARSTFAVPLLGRPGTLIEVEFVCAGTAKPGLFSSSEALGLPVSNPKLKPYGKKDARIYDGVGIAPNAGMYWTAGVTPPMAKPDAPANSPERFGDMKTQAVGTLKRLQENLAAVGLTFKDVVYLRAFLAPDKSGTWDYDGWNAGYGEFFATAANPHKPARTTITTPNFGGSGVMLEVEIIAAFPGVPGAPGATITFDSATSPNLKDYGLAASPISSGIAAKPGTGFYFSAGAVPTVGGDMKAQALSTLELLKTRLADAGMTFKDVTFLRAYVVYGDSTSAADRQGWNEAYTTYFNNPQQPHKPARTTIAVQSLPKPEWKIEIDVIAASPTPIP